ncbi:patched domain-containing protein 3-like [Convolutriloba macropyga]|uniref:patched domain-containing protein 3-like n=1 Tax=Convolutriloba macropyga TaxID=536237 RepID=UPI003F526265
MTVEPTISGEVPKSENSLQSPSYKVTNGSTKDTSTRDNSSENEEPMSDDACNALNCGCLEKCSNVVTGFIEGIFYKIGMFNGRRPWAGILIGLFIFLVPLAGIARFYEETDGSKLWVPQSSRAVEDFDRSNLWFPGYNRIAQAIIVASNVLDATILERALTLDERIKNISVVNDGQILAYSELCSKAGPYCLGNSLLELWSYDRTTIEGLTNPQIVSTVNSATISPVTNAEIDVSLMIGEASDSNGDGDIDVAKAMSLTYFISTEETFDKPQEYIREWEQKFLDVCEEGVGGGATVYYFAVRSFGDIGGGAIDDDLQFLAGGYILVIIYLIVALGKFNCRDQKIYMAICGVVCIGMAMGISYGISSAIGLYFAPLHNILPFLLLGIGVDDMFVFVAAWDNLSPEEKTKPLPEKIALMTRHAGVSILITSLTDFAAFTIGATTIIPALRSFCIYAAMGILGIFLVTLFLFAGCFTYDQKRAAANRNACICCIKLGDNYKPNDCSENPLSVRVFDKVIARGLSYLPVKVIVVVMTVVFLGLGLWGTIEIEQDYQEEWFIPKGNYLYDQILISDKYFPEDGYDAYVYMGAIDYYTLKDNLLTMKREVGNVDKVSSGSIDFWLSAFYQWTNSTTNATYTSYITNGEPTDSAAFDYLAGAFINETQEGSSYQSDVQFDDNGKVLRSRMFLRFVKTDTSAEGISGMDDTRDAVDKPNLWSEDEVYIFGEIMLTWEGDKVIRAELFRNVGLAFIVVFLVCMLLIANIVTVALVLSCVVFTLVDVIGFLHLWGNTINVVTTIMVILAVGLAVDYAAHIGHTFMVSTGSRQHRMRVTLREIGTAVFNGGFSTFLAFLPLALSVSFVFKKFFQIFLLVSIFGLFHGLIFLPVMLSWIGPSPYQSVVANSHDSEFNSTNHEPKKKDEEKPTDALNNYGFVKE